MSDQSGPGHCLTMSGKTHKLRAVVLYGLVYWLTVRPTATFSNASGSKLALCNVSMCP